MLWDVLQIGFQSVDKKRLSLSCQLGLFMQRKGAAPLLPLGHLYKLTFDTLLKFGMVILFSQSIAL